MKRNFFHDGPEAGRQPLGFWLPALTLLIASFIGAGWAFHWHDSASAPRDSSQNEPYPAEQSTPIVCLGIADLDGGVLSLHPTVPGRVVEVPVAENEVVRAGATLLRLD